ncbi:MAG TPA: Spy/CpxP family protein refolding chaperone [Thermoanaerobaculia bacterium]|nr:Spy/CpxP family protein refolding chaperone [Thermoanaerobaculia bacterium]
MKTRSKILLASSIALLVPALLVAQAAQSHLERLGGHGGFARRIVQKLDLSKAQIQQIKTIFANHKTELSTELTALEKARGEMFDAIHADTLDETAIRNAATGVGQAESDLAVSRAKVLGEVRQVLNPTQQAKLKELLADARAFGEGFFSRLHAHLTDPLAGI